MREKFLDRIARTAWAGSFGCRKRAFEMPASQKRAKVGQLNFNQTFMSKQSPHSANTLNQKIVGDPEGVANGGILVDQFENFLTWKANDNIRRFLKLFQT